MVKYLSVGSCSDRRYGEHNNRELSSVEGSCDMGKKSRSSISRIRRTLMEILNSNCWGVSSDVSVCKYFDDR